MLKSAEMIAPKSPIGSLLVLLLAVGCNNATSTTASNTAPNQTTPAGSEGTAAPPLAVEDVPPAATPDAAAPSVSVDVPTPIFAPPRNVQLRPGARPPRGTTRARGRTEWTVVVAADISGTPALQAVFTHALNTLHLGASVGELRCSPPVSGSYPATIPTGDGAQIVAVHFATEAQARQLATAMVEPPLWIGQTSVMCAD